MKNKKLLIGLLIFILSTTLHLLLTINLYSRINKLDTKYINPIVPEVEGFNIEDCTHLNYGIWVCTDGSKVDTGEMIDMLKDVNRETEIPEPEDRIKFIGRVSYYSHDGCIGCREDQLMANGDKFNENAMTLAFNRLPLNTDVQVCNLDSNICEIAKVTDTGGFEMYDRIADLSKGLYERLEAKTDVSNIKITVL